MNQKQSRISTTEYKEIVQKIKKEEEEIYKIPLNIEGKTREEFIDTILDLWMEEQTSAPYEKLDLKTKATLSFKLIKDVPYLYYEISTAGFAIPKENSAYVSIGSSLLEKSGLQKQEHYKYEVADKILTIYHEIKHLLQYNDPKIDAYSKACNNIARIYITIYPSQYKLHHDSFYNEIEANIYGIHKTENFLKKQPILYKNNKKYIETRKRNYNFDLNNFDFDKFVSQLLIIDKNNKFFYYVKNKILPTSDRNNKFKTPEEEKLFYSLAANKEFVKACFKCIGNFKKQDFELFISAINWKKETLEKKIEYNNNWLTKGDYNINDQIKVILANKKLKKRLKENKELEEYIYSKKDVFKDTRNPLLDYLDFLKDINIKIDEETLQESKLYSVNNEYPNEEDKNKKRK